MAVRENRMCLALALNVEERWRPFWRVTKRSWAFASLYWTIGKVVAYREWRFIPHPRTGFHRPVTRRRLWSQYRRHCFGQFL